jgi:hypothetical protein
MLVPETGRLLAAKLRRTGRKRRRPLAHPSEAAAVTGLVRTADRRADLSGQEARLTLGQSQKELSGSPGQSAELLGKASADEDVVLLRRGECPQATRWDILTPMVGSSSSGTAKEVNESDASAAIPDGVSAFIARVLDQLTLSAWLPAALFTASMAILLQFRRQGSLNVPHALRVLTANPLRVLVLMIPLLVIATVVTQAFSFEAIRSLEGYWRRRGLANLARTLMIRRHVRRKEAIIARRLKAAEKAFYVAEPRMLRAGIPFSLVNALKAGALELEELPR